MAIQATRCTLKSGWTNTGNTQVIGANTFVEYHVELDGDAKQMLIQQQVCVSTDC